MKSGKAISTRRKIVGGSAAIALGLGLVLTGGAAANAISRTSSCAPQVLNLVSNHTTCWEYAGYTTVTLYNVYTLISGNNAGYIQGSDGQIGFGKWVTTGIPEETVSGIRIY